jgi:thiamine-monophosphate kinase
MKSEADFLRGLRPLMKGRPWGDDAAWVKPSRKTQLLTADMLVENVHFTRRQGSPRQWGRKAICCNISDVAAMGGKPQYALMSLGLPQDFEQRKAHAIMRGALKACGEFDVELVGGDTARSEQIVISVAMVGIAANGVVKRSGAKPGDFVFVTGRLGGTLDSGKHLDFIPRLRESQFLMSHYRVHAMIDVSDGLSKDLGHLAEESRVGFRIYASSIPLHRGIRNRARAFLDGEDFELLFTLASKEAKRLLQDTRPQEQGFRFYPLGRAVPLKKGLKIVDLKGKEMHFPRMLDHHFTRS